MKSITFRVNMDKITIKKRRNSFAYGITKKKLCVRSAGSFKVMQIADLQEIPAISPDTLKLMNAALDREKPDLVVFTGDQIKGYGITFRGGDRKKKRWRIPCTGCWSQWSDVIFPLPRSLVITTGRWAALTRSRMQIYQRYEQCVGMDDPALPGCGTYDLPIYSNDGQKILFNLYLIDSHGSAKGGGYAPVDPKQIEWYRATRDRLTQENNGEPVPSLVFQHIPVPEYYNVLLQVPHKTPGAVRAYRTHKNESYILNPDMVDAGGFMRESPAIPDINTGEFDAIAEKGDVMAMFVGHDHINSFVGHYQNVDLVYTPGSGFNVYGPGVERAVRVIELNENQPHAYESHTLSYEELFGKKVSNPVKDFFYVHSPTTPEAAVPLILKTLGVVTASVAFIVLLKKLLS